MGASTQRLLQLCRRRSSPIEHDSDQSLSFDAAICSVSVLAMDAKLLSEATLEAGQSDESTDVPHVLQWRASSAPPAASC